jgi:DNA-binding transcriptional MocR family regulator
MKGGGFSFADAGSRAEVQRLHNPPMPAWDVLVTAGNTDALAKVLEMFINEASFLCPLPPHLD